MNLLNETIELVRSSELTYEVIAKESGVSPRWINYLMSRGRKNPQINHVQRVYDFLISQTQTLDAA